MRLLHSADWHIGRQFHNVSLLEDQRAVLDQLMGIIEQRQVDVLLIAGDIYDRAVPSADAVRLLDEVLHRISIDLKTPVIMIAGNHDSPDRLAFGARQLAGSGIHIAGPLTAPISPVVLADEHGEVAFFCLPYADPATVRLALNVEDVHSHDQAMGVLTDEVKSVLKPDQRSVVLSHCFLAGGSISDSERPLSVGGADMVSLDHFRDFDYVALGHLHGPQHRGEPHIRYSGSLLKYSFSEEHHEKSVCLVDLLADGSVEIEEIPLVPGRDLRVIEGEMAEILANAEQDARRDDYLMVRLRDKGAILNSMDKIRAVYPNVLHLEKRPVSPDRDAPRRGEAGLEHGPMGMFRDFYRETTGETLSGTAEALVVSVLDSLNQQDEA